MAAMSVSSAINPSNRQLAALEVGSDYLRLTKCPAARGLRQVARGKGPRRPRPAGEHGAHNPLSTTAGRGRRAQGLESWPRLSNNWAPQLARATQPAEADR